MVPQTQPRKKRNSSRTNLLISLAFHSLIVVVGFYLAARGGVFGNQLKKIAIDMVKEKPPEKPKEPEKPKVEPPKPEPPKEVAKMDTPKVVEVPKLVPPPSDVPPAVAPPAPELRAFEFDGGRAVTTAGNPVDVYKGLLQSTFTAKWKKPDDSEDEKYVAEVQVSISRDGRISDPQWMKKSGDKRWDDSVKQALAAVKGMDNPPPTNFPPHVIIRFDVQETAEPIFQ